MAILHAVCLADPAQLPILSYDGRFVIEHTHVERFCRKCRHKFLKDVKPDRVFFKYYKLGIKQAPGGGPTDAYCGDCCLEFLQQNQQISDWF